jgi:HPt (histidine-containing phosphotransfer) domain-containing protein
VKIPEDPVVRELLPEFVDSWIDDIESQYEQLVESRNSEDLFRMAHTLKGSCFQFGLDDIANLGIELMGYARNSVWDKAEEMQELLIKSFKSVKKEIAELM